MTSPKFKSGQLVKLVREDCVYYNYVVDSYFNESVGQHMYRLEEKIAMPVYREDWLEAVDNKEISAINHSGALRAAKMGGYNLPLDIYNILDR